MLDELAAEVLVFLRLLTEEKRHLVQRTAEGDQSAEHVRDLLHVLELEARRPVRKIALVVAAAEFALMDEVVEAVDGVERDLAAERVAGQDHPAVRPVLRQVRSSRLYRLQQVAERVDRTVKNCLAHRVELRLRVGRVVDRDVTDDISDGVHFTLFDVAEQPVEPPTSDRYS